MSGDIVERLNDLVSHVDPLAPSGPGVRRALIEAAAEITRLRAALSWVDEVYPDNLPWSGARVEMTWGEFNAMRTAIGLVPRQRIGAPADVTAGWRTRALAAESLLAEAERVMNSLPPIFEEIHKHWDGDMKAGKLLIALLDPTLRYRPDITAFHAFLSTREKADG